MEAHARQLEREMEENIAIISLGRKVKEWNAEEIAGLKQQLTAHKAALDKARVALERAYQVAELPSDQIAFSAALTAINSLQQCPTTPTANG